jgi:hypothetical protein
MMMRCSLAMTRLRCLVMLAMGFLGRFARNVGQEFRKAADRSRARYWVSGYDAGYKEAGHDVQRAITRPREFMVGPDDKRPVFLRLVASLAEAARAADPELDGTDYAHAAWWRGNDAGFAGASRLFESALNEKPQGVVADVRVQRLRERIWGLVEESRKHGERQKLIYMSAQSNTLRAVTLAMDGVKVERRDPEFQAVLDRIANLASLADKVGVVGQCWRDIEAELAAWVESRSRGGEHAG